MLIKFVLLQFLFLLPSLLSSHLIESEFKNVFAFPKNFSFGASSAAYQVEGGFDADGKGPSIWDTLVHEHPEMISDGTNGDVGDDSYHRYMDDVKALKEVGVSFNFYGVLKNKIVVLVSTLSLFDIMGSNLSIWN